MTTQQDKKIAFSLSHALERPENWCRFWMRGRAINCASRKPFRGLNRLSLTAVSYANDWQSNTWGTATQWKKRRFDVPRHAEAVAVYSMVEAKEGDTILLRYGAKAVNMVVRNDEYAGIQVGDDDSYTPLPLNPHALEELIRSAVPVYDTDGDSYCTDKLVAVPALAYFKGTSTTTAIEKRCSVLARRGLEYVIRNHLHLTAEQHDSLIVALAGEIGAGFLCQDFGMVPERSDAKRLIRDIRERLGTHPDIAIQAAGMAQHAIDWCAEAAAHSQDTKAA